MCFTDQVIALTKQEMVISKTITYQVKNSLCLPGLMLTALSPAMNSTSETVRGKETGQYKHNVLLNSEKA